MSAPIRMLKSYREGTYTNHATEVRKNTRFIALIPLIPLSRRRARGNAQQGAPPCAPTPLAHSVGEGLGVRAQRVFPHPLCLPHPQAGEGGLWSAEAKLPPDAEAALQHSKGLGRAHCRAPLHPSPTLWERGWG